MIRRNHLSQTFICESLGKTYNLLCICEDVILGWKKPRKKPIMAVSGENHNRMQDIILMLSSVRRTNNEEKEVSFFDLWKRKMKHSLIVRLQDSVSQQQSLVLILSGSAHGSDNACGSSTQRLVCQTLL